MPGEMATLPGENGQEEDAQSSDQIFERSAIQFVFPKEGLPLNLLGGIGGKFLCERKWSIPGQRGSPALKSVVDGRAKRC